MEFHIFHHSSIKQFFKFFLTTSYYFCTILSGIEIKPKSEKKNLTKISIVIWEKMMGLLHHRFKKNPFFKQAISKYWIRICFNELSNNLDILSSFLCWPYTLIEAFYSHLQNKKSIDVFQWMPLPYELFFKSLNIPFTVHHQHANYRIV